MGKVYEALKKAESEGNQAGWSSVVVDDEPDRAREQSADDVGAFNFVDYSLNAPHAPGVGQAAAAAAAAEALSTPRADSSPAGSSGEVTLDPRQIAPQLISFHDAHTAATEEFNRLAVTLISASSERLIKRVLVASAQHGEGRTSVTLNLACALARAQRRVLVVDADLHNPSMHRQLGLSVESGLGDALEGGLPFESAVIRVQPFGFDLLPTRAQVKNPAELLSSSSFKEMLDGLDRRYDFVLFDSSPLLTAADSNLLIRYVHAAVLVIRSGKTSSGQVGRAVAPLTQEKILGVVLNRTGRAARAAG
jgi:capsular exopolysaccharide synthesis family protein